MTTSAPIQERWYPTDGNPIAITDAANALKRWWNAPYKFQRSEQGAESLMEASIFSLMVSRGEEGFTEDEVMILSRKINELKVSCEIGVLISRGDICVSLIESNLEELRYDIAFRSTK
jgi:hypothetical protein